MITVTTKVHFTTTKAGRTRMHAAPGPKLAASSPGHVPRISKLMALAIKFDRLLREGKVADQSELARLAHVTQPRMTQIMNLNHLAPDIQEELLFLSPHGDEAVDRALLALPPKLLKLAKLLMTGTPASAAKALGISQRRLYADMAEIRRRFRDAGLGGPP